MLRRRCFVLAGFLALALVAGNISAPTAAGAQPEPSDEIELTRLLHPDGTAITGIRYNDINGVIEVNERGQVIAVEPSPVSSGGDGIDGQATLWEDGHATVLNATPQEQLRPTDISNQGHVVGKVESAFLNAAIGAFFWHDGRFSWVNPWWDDGYGSLFATSVNDQGQMSMWFLEQDGGTRLAVWDAGEITMIPEGVVFLDSGNIFSSTGHRRWRSVINDRGQVAFNMRVDGNSHAAIWDASTGEVTDLGTLGGDTSYVEDMNGLGMATGTSATADGQEHAFFWHDGEMTDLGTLGGDISRASDINEWGQVVGSSRTGEGTWNGFMWSQGEMTEIAPLGGVAAAPAAINNWGQVVGSSLGDAFLWQNGRIVNLGEVIGPGRSEAVDINDRGQIIGTVGGETYYLSEAVLWTVSPLWGYTDPDDPASDLAAAREKWDENRPDTYRVTITQFCFCPPEIVEPHTVTVEGDEVTDVDPPIPGSLGVEPLTIDALFDVLERAVVEADELDVSYNEVYGFPESIDIDWIEDAVDDEVSYSAESFAEFVID